MRISDWSSDVCSSDLSPEMALAIEPVVSNTNITSVFGRRISASQVTSIVLELMPKIRMIAIGSGTDAVPVTFPADSLNDRITVPRSEEHTSELQSLMRISYAVFCLKKKKKTNTDTQIKKKKSHPNHKTYSRV